MAIAEWSGLGATAKTAAGFLIQKIGEDTNAALFGDEPLLEDEERTGLG